MTWLSWLVAVLCALGEAAWLPPQGRRPYWRGTIASLEYEFSE